MNTAEKVTIIYNTCDKYECLWDGFFTLLERYWEGVENYTIIFNTESKNYSFNKLKIKGTQKVPSSTPWSKRLLNSLTSVKTPYVLMMLDDFYLKSSVDIGVLYKDVSILEKNKDIKCITYAWQPGPNKPYNSN